MHLLKHGDTQLEDYDRGGRGDRGDRGDRAREASPRELAEERVRWNGSESGRRRLFASAAGIGTSREVSGVEAKREEGRLPLIGGGRELASGDGRPLFLRAAATLLAWLRAAACAASGSYERLIRRVRLCGNDDGAKIPIRGRLLAAYLLSGQSVRISK